MKKHHIHILLSLLLLGCGGKSTQSSDDASTDTRNQGETSTYPDGGPSPIVDLESDKLYDMPFPSDLRRIPTGGIDLTGFPNPNNLAIVNNYLGYAQEKLDGFSLTPSIGFRFDASINPATITAVKKTRSAASAVQIINIDTDSSEYGQRTAVQIHWWGDEKAQYLSPNTLTLQPIFGTPLKAGTTYAALVTRTTRDHDDKRLTANPTVALGLQGEGPLSDVYAPLRHWIDDKDDIVVSDIAVASVFTTGNPTGELRAIRAHMHETFDPPHALGIIKSDEQKHSDYVIYEGLYQAPNFQSGEKPYDEGGEILFDENGKPVLGEMETIRFALTVPEASTDCLMPDAGWPTVLYGHGTGGDYRSFLVGKVYPVGRELAKECFAVMSIDQPLHGIRYDGDIDLDIYSFNFVNLRAAMSNFRQSAIDVMSQVRLVRNLFIVPASVSTTGEEIRLDGERISFFGHSHGALSGTMLAAIETDILGYVLSAAGGGLSYTLVLRKDPFDIKAFMEGVLKITNPHELTIAHPIIALAQNLADITDPLTYAPLYRDPGDGRPPVNILLTEGTLDEQTPALTTDNLAAAARIPILKDTAQESVAHTLLGMQPVTPPIVGNWSTRPNVYGTSLLARFKDDDHFAIFSNTAAYVVYMAFLKSLTKYGLPRID
jgi:pimeloyl-ACP methyl ester carboxylesterase